MAGPCVKLPGACASARRGAPGTRCSSARRAGTSVASELPAGRYPTRRSSRARTGSTSGPARFLMDVIFCSRPNTGRALPRPARRESTSGARESGRHPPVFSELSGAVYAPPGYVVFARDGQLMAAPFDLDAGRITGEPVSLGEAVPSDTSFYTAAVSAAATGTLALRPSPAPAVSTAAGQSGVFDSELALLTRDGSIVSRFGGVQAMGLHGRVAGCAFGFVVQLTDARRAPPTSGGSTSTPAREPRSRPCATVAGTLGAGVVTRWDRAGLWLSAPGHSRRRVRAGHAQWSSKEGHRVANAVGASGGLVARRPVPARRV